MSNPIVLGKFGAAYGVRGWLHLISYTDPIKNIFDHPQWRVKHRGQWVTLEVEDGKAHNKGLIVKIRGIDDRELAREYTNDEITILSENLPKLSEEEHYWKDLIGMTVVTKEKINLGVVKELLATGSNDVFVVMGERERLIPYTNDVIINIDKHQNEITVDWDPEF